METGLNLWQSISGWLLTSGLLIGRSIIVSLVILAIAKIVVRFTVKGLHAALKRHGRVSEILEKFILNTVRKALWILAGVIVISQFGIDIGPLIAGLGVTGFILGFAFQETIGNLLAGVMISLNQPFGIGEYVDIGGVMGTVKNMDMISITLHTPDNKRIVMANKLVWGKPIVNYSVLGTRRVDMTFGISYGSDIRKAREIIQGEIEKLSEVLPEPAPLVEVLAMSDSSVDLTTRIWVKTSDYWKVFYALNQQVKYAFDACGIEIPFPQVDVHHYGLEKPDVPPSRAIPVRESGPDPILTASAAAGPLAGAEPTAVGKTSRSSAAGVKPKKTGGSTAAEKPARG